jgi:Protein of unknown function (DUF3352)
VRRLLVVLVVFTAVAAVSVRCGGDAPVAGNALDDALRYLPADAGTVVVVSTDLESDQFKTFDEKVARRAAGGSVEEELRRAAEEEAGLSFDQDVKPLLGNHLVVGVTGAEDFLGLGGDDGGQGGFVSALRTRDEAKLRALVEERLGFTRTGEAEGATLYRAGEGSEVLAVDGDVLVFADREETLRGALARRDGDDHLTAERLGDHLGDLPEDALVRAYTDARPLLASIPDDRVREIRWVSALRSVALAVGIEDERLAIDVTLSTDPDAVTDADLPVVPDDETPEVVSGYEGEIVGASRNQSQTTVFLLRAARVLFPDSRFVRDVDALERDLGIDFEEEVLRQFDGPSASAVSPDGETFAARSTVRDPERLAEHLDELAPHLPTLVEHLQPLRSEGMALLFLFAPDAPSPIPLAQVQVTPPSEPDRLYRISGLTGDGPEELHFGLVGDVFVVASDEERARAIAEADTEPIEVVEGASVFRADGDVLAQQAEQAGGGEFLPFTPRGFREVAGALDASRERLRAMLRLELE